MNSSGIVTLGGETYIVAVFSEGNGSYEKGFAIAQHVCAAVGQSLTSVAPDESPAPAAASATATAIDSN